MLGASGRGTKARTAKVIQRDIRFRVSVSELRVAGDIQKPKLGHIVLQGLTLQDRFAQDEPGSCTWDFVAPCAFIGHAYKLGGNYS